LRGTNEGEGGVNHTFLFPYATVTFGYTTPYIMELKFQHKFDGEGNDEITILALEATDEYQITTNMDALVEDFDSNYTQFVLQCTLEGVEHWDTSKTWW